jgi:DNA-binding transcriptional regulator LsrR (DeoR family)
MSNDYRIAVLDFERENRLSKDISLYSKGLNQEELAQELHIAQSTVSEDLQYIKHELQFSLLINLNPAFNDSLLASKVHNIQLNFTAFCLKL